MKWVITGVSRLTGERVSLSVPMEKERGDRLLRLVQKRQHSGSAYSRLKLQPACGEGWCFNRVKF